MRCLDLDDQSISPSPVVSLIQYHLDSLIQKSKYIRPLFLSCFLGIKEQLKLNKEAFTTWL